MAADAAAALVAGRGGADPRRHHAAGCARAGHSRRAGVDPVGAVRDRGVVVEMDTEPNYRRGFKPPANKFKTC